MANSNQTDSNQSGSKPQNRNQNTDRQNQAGNADRSSQGNTPNVKDPSRNAQRRDQRVPAGTNHVKADDSQQDDNQLEIRDDEEDLGSHDADANGVRDAGEENPPNEEGNPNIRKNRGGDQVRREGNRP